MFGKIVAFNQELHLPIRGCVSFDFDETLTKYVHGKQVGNEPVIHRLKLWTETNDVYIVTHRNKEGEGTFPGKLVIEDLIKQHSMNVADVIYTAMGDKGDVMLQLGAELHYDDKWDNLQSVARVGCNGVHVTSTLDR